MDAFDRIIGYSRIKCELRQVADSLKNGEVYARLGVKAPQGMLLYGEPGVGKTLMASALIEESGRPVFPCRKDEPNGDFIRLIKETFLKAAEEAPSIVFLDDMDKFANGDESRPDSEEYVTVQSCIDEVKGRNVYVLATANSIRALPRSLRRAGRFDRVVEIQAPRGRDAELITAHFLEGKKFTGGIDPRPIARIMDGRSTAELETVINEAGIYAGYERAESITMEHFMRACLKLIFGSDAADPDYDDDDYFSGAACSAEEGCFDTDPGSSCGSGADPEADGADGSRKAPFAIALHEAGHTVIHEALCPESVTLVCAEKDRGFTHYYRTGVDANTWTCARIIGSLGGLAAVEMKNGVLDWGSSSDLDQAFRYARGLVGDQCACGFSLHSYGYNDSEALKEKQEIATASEIERYYRRAKEILAANERLLYAVAEEVSRKGLLTMEDVSRLKEQNGIALFPAA